MQLQQLDCREERPGQKNRVCKTGYYIHQEMISTAIHIIQLSGQRCEAQAPVNVHSTPGIYAQHFCKCFLELRSLKVFLLQGFSQNVLLFCSEPAKSDKIQLPRVQVTGLATEPFPQRKGSRVHSHQGKEKGNIHGNLWTLLEKALSSCPQNNWKLFRETLLSHEQRVL